LITREAPPSLKATAIVTLRFLITMEPLKAIAKSPKTKNLPNARPRKFAVFEGKLDILPLRREVVKRILESV
jgi:hypothetical protein